MKRLPLKQYPKSGFSLTELLVAIGVIAIIGSLLFPVMKRMKEKSAEVKCVANLRQWGTILQAYIAESGGTYRNWYSGTRNHQDAAQYWTWYMVTPLKYSTAELQKTRCPAGPGKPTDITAYHYGFYAADAYGKKVNNPGGLHYEIQFATHSTPSKAILLADSLDGNGLQAHTIFPDNLITRGGIHARHGNNANIYFLDGHIETAGPQRLSDLGVTKYYDKDGKTKSSPTAN